MIECAVRGWWFCVNPGHAGNIAHPENSFANVLNCGSCACRVVDDVNLHVARVCACAVFAIPAVPRSRPRHSLSFTARSRRLSLVTLAATGAKRFCTSGGPSSPRSLCSRMPLAAAGSDPLRGPVFGWRRHRIVSTLNHFACGSI